MQTLIWKPNFSRIAECILGTFHVSLILFLFQMCIDNIMDLMSIREGYFILRIFFRRVKEPEFQMKITEKIKHNFKWFVTNRNGSLLCQCLIHNFPVVKYVYNKSCSSFIKKKEGKGGFDDNMLEEETRDVEKNFNNKALFNFVSLIIRNCSFWDNHHVTNIVECAIKNTKNLFENECLSLINKKNSIFFNCFLSLKNGPRIYKRMRKAFSKEGYTVLSQFIKHKLGKSPPQGWNFLLEEENLPLMKHKNQTQTKEYNEKSVYSSYPEHEVSNQKGYNFWKQNLDEKVDKSISNFKDSDHNNQFESLFKQHSESVSLENSLLENKEEIITEMKSKRKKTQKKEKSVSLSVESEEIKEKKVKKKKSIKSKFLSNSRKSNTSATDLCLYSGSIHAYNARSEHLLFE